MAVGRSQIFPYAYVYNKTMVWLAWNSSSTGADSFLTRSDSSNLFFAFSKDDLKHKFEDVGYDAKWDECSVFDFDAFWKRLANMRTRFGSNKKTCEILLDGFNFLHDVASSINKYSEGDVQVLSADIYDKLFSGCNLPSMTPENKMYVPMWSKEEIREIRKVARQLWDFSGLAEYAGEANNQ